MQTYEYNEGPYFKVDYCPECGKTHLLRVEDINTQLSPDGNTEFYYFCPNPKPPKVTFSLSEEEIEKYNKGVADRNHRLDWAAMNPLKDRR